jgi:hypothetical protein
MIGVVMSHKNIFTASDLRAGLEKLQRPLPAAILFSLQTGLLPHQVVTLTWSEARRLRLDELSLHILQSQPVNIKSKYVFWHYINNKALPLFGLEMELFDAFNMVWSELAESYANMLWIDYEAEIEAMPQMLELMIERA